MSGFRAARLHRALAATAALALCVMAPAARAEPAGEPAAAPEAVPQPSGAAEALPASGEARAEPAPAPAAAPAPEPAPDSAPAAGTEPAPAAPAVPPAPAPEAAWGVRYGLEGYYRARALHLTNLADEELPSINFDPVGGRSVQFPRITSTNYLMHRLRLTPSLTLAKGDPKAGGKIGARAYAQIDVLNDVVWGDNAGLSSAPLFATSPSNTGFLGGTLASLEIPRVWVEVKLPVGELRVGRMPSHWGMGLLANGGGSLLWDPSSTPESRRFAQDTYFANNDFGDSHYGSTNDRILFATKPVEVATLGRVKSNLLAGYAFDKISEAPLLADEPWSAQNRPYSQSGFLSQKNAVDEHVILALYKNTEWHPGTLDEIWGGVYIVLRTQDYSCTNPSKTDRDGNRVCDADTGSFVPIYDLYGKVRYGPFYAEGEGFTIQGDTFGGVPAPANSHQKASIWGGVGRVGFLTRQLDFIAETGYASGDLDLYAQDDGDTFSQRPLAPDYGVGLILYRETLRERSARRLVAGAPGAVKTANPEGAKGFASLGGVLDSVYVNPRVRWRAPGKLSGLKVVGGVLMAWLDTYNLTGQPKALFFPEDGRGKYLGTEFDLGVNYEFFDGHVMIGLETGYLLFGDALRRDYDAPGSFTLQSRLAVLTW